MFEDAIFVCISVTVFLIGTTKVKVRRTLFKWVLQMFFQSILDLTEAKVFKFTNLTNRKHGSTWVKGAVELLKV